jgi:hypothetical protein
LREPVTGVAVKGFPEELDRRFRSAEQQLCKSAKAEPDTVPSIALIEAHGPFNRRRRLLGPTEEGCIVAGEPMRRSQPVIHSEGLRKCAFCQLQLACRRVEHPLNEFRHCVTGCQVQSDRNRLAPKIGRRSGSPRITPPGIADQILTGERQACERFHIARIVGQRGEVRCLGLGSELRRDFALQSTRRLGETLGNPEIQTRCSRGPAAGCLKEQDVEFPRNPSGDPRLDRSEVLGLEFMPAGPKVLRARRISYSHVHPQ